MKCLAMGRRFRQGFSAAEKTELWDRRQQGESIKAIGPALLASDANSLLNGTGNYFRETGNSVARTGNFIGRN